MHHLKSSILDGCGKSVVRPRLSFEAAVARGGTAHVVRIGGVDTRSRTGLRRVVVVARMATGRTVIG